MMLQLGRFTGLRVAALPGFYPIEVFPGDQVKMNSIQFDYQGQAGTFYVCWGLKAGTGDFNNGANLEGGAIASASFTVPQTSEKTKFTITVNAILTISPTMRVGRTYDTYIWLSTVASAQEANFVHAPDTDAGIVKILAVTHVFSNIQAAYV